MLGLGTQRRATDRAGDDEDSALEDPRGIARVLAQVVESRSLLSVMEDSGRSHVSTLLEIDADRSVVVIDEPATGSIAVGASVRISTRIDGVLVRFASRVLAHGRDAGGGLYRLELPRRLERHQRRAHHRAPVTSALPVSITLASEDGTSVVGEVRDLSAGGLCARLPDGAAVPVEGERLPCTLSLGEEAEIQCSLEPRRHHESGRVVLMGARLLDLEPRDRQVLERFVAGLEREALRKRRG